METRKLSPAVTELFGFFFADSRSLNGDAKTHVIVDDSQRLFLRSNKVFDIITLDPPPPIEAATSRLLYSGELYEIAKTHLAPGRICDSSRVDRPDRSGRREI